MYEALQSPSPPEENAVARTTFTTAEEEHECPDSITEQMVGMVDQRLERLRQIQEELGEVLDWMDLTISEAEEKVRILKAKAQAADELRTKLREKGFEVDATLTRFGMSVTELKSAIRMSERREQKSEEEMQRLREEEIEKERRGKSGGDD